MNKLKKKIKDKGLKISWISNQIGIPQPTLSMYLSEKRTMPIDVEFRIKKLLNL